MGKDYSFFKYLFDEEIYLIQPKKRPESVTFRGNVIIVEYPGIVTLPTKEKLLLNKILEAVKLQPVQVRIVNISEIRNRLSTRSNIKFENAKVIFFTGKVPILIKAEGVDKKYEIISISNNEFLLADPLEKIDQEQNLKKQLWEVLQKLFPIL